MRHFGFPGILNTESDGGKAGTRVIGKPLWACLAAVGLFWITPLPISAQQNQTKPPENIPDAPSAVRPPQPVLPSEPAAGAPSSPAGDNSPPSASQPPNSDRPSSAEAPSASASPPSPSVKTVAPGKETPYPLNTRDQIYTLKRNVSFVAVPVTVKDKGSGQMVDGLLPQDFQVFENGVKQKLSYFTSDPFFISAAVIFDLGMSDEALRKVQQTFPALLAAFSAYDQVSIYTYSSAVTRVADFSAVNQQLTEALNQLKTVSGRNNGVAVTSGPMTGPTVNGLPVGGTPPPVSTPPREAHVLNDAILRAARDLSKQDRSRRRVIFVIGTGRELRSTASYADTLRVLLSNEITVYGVATGSSALPIYNKVSKLHIPQLGYDNLIPRYTAATGGEVFTEFSASAIDTAYAQAMSYARNQYTLGYQTKAPLADTYRDIEVRVDIPNLVVRAKTGYYPLPPQRSVPQP